MRWRERKGETGRDRERERDKETKSLVGYRSINK